MFKKRRNIIILLFIIVFIIIMAFWGLSNQTYGQFWNENTTVECLPNSHANLALHIHPTLEIYVDNEMETIPANVGIRSGCMAEIHTHDTSNVLHVESFDRNKDFVLQDFFDVWEKFLERDGYNIEMTVNGEVNEEYGNLILRDKDHIVLKYFSL